MKKLVLIALFSLFLGVANLFAPPSDPPGGDGGGDPITDPAGVPIDGGLGFLAAAGIAYAGKKFYDKKKENEDT